MLEIDKIYNMDCIEGIKMIPDGYVDCVVTSPPYYMQRDYEIDGQIGLEENFDDYIGNLMNVFTEIKRVLKSDGTFWLNIGDGYATGTKAGRQQSLNPGVGANRKDVQNSVRRVGNPNGCKTKDLIGIPWILAFALRSSGWYLRQDIIWNKPNAMPESVNDRCTKSHEYIFLLSKSERYYVNQEYIKEQSESGLRNRRDVWSFCVKPSYGGHKAAFPIELPYMCISIGCKDNGIVLDPFIGSGTTAIAAIREKRHFIGFELNEEYYKIASKRIKEELMQPTLF